MNKENSRPLSKAQQAELAALAAMREEWIHIAAIPEVRDWSGARRGAFFRPIKQQLTIRLDADLIAWFKAHAAQGQGYQTSINRALRAFVIPHQQKG